jgi:hypothetical protein
MKVILDLCGGTGAWSKDYANAGYRVLNITLPIRDLTEEKTVEYCISQNPYGIFFAVDCTVWANSGARWFDGRSLREIFYYSKLLVKGLRIIYNTIPKFWVIENPVGKMREFLGDPQFIFNPCDFGDAYTKKTLLWGKFNIHYCPPGERRKEIRSITPAGFARAFYEANK